MPSRSFTFVAPLATICLMLCASIADCRAADEEARPNVLVIMVEDLNDWVGYLGGPKVTPNIDRLASTSHQFFNAYCASPVCNSSRVALWTGQRPSVTGVTGNLNNFREMSGGTERITIPQFFRQNGGYNTVAAGKVFHQPRGRDNIPNPLSDPVSWNFQNRGSIGADGMRHYLDGNNRALWLEGATSNSSYLDRFCVWGFARNHDGSLQKPTETGEWEQAEFAKTFLAQEHDSPFFLAVGFGCPHQPYLAPKEYFDRLEEIYPAGIPSVPLPESDLDDVPNSAKANFTSPMVDLIRSKGQLKNAVAGYLASLMCADDAVGQVIDALESSKFADNTIVIFASDHGIQLGHKNRWEKFELWKQSTKVPLLIRLPGQNQSREIHQSVSLLDIYPTLTDLAKLPENKNTHGQSLTELMASSKPLPIRSAVTTGFGHYRLIHSYSVYQDDWNYIRRHDGFEELYDHSNDPHEFENVAHVSSNALRKRRMATELVRTAIRVANTDFDFSGVQILGAHAAESFEGNEGSLDNHSNWQTLFFNSATDNSDFVLANNRVESLPGRVVSKFGEIVLGESSDFTMSADVYLKGSGIAAGVAFGIKDPENYFELLISEAQLNDGVNVEFRRWHDGESVTYLTETGLPDASPGTRWNFVVDYKSRNQTLTLKILDDNKSVYFKRKIETTIEPQTQFGISSYYHANVEFDNFRLLVAPQLPLAKPKGQTQMVVDPKSRR